MGRTKAALALFFFFALGCVWAAAQSISGSISGTVVDPKSLAIPGANVVLTNTGTSVQLTTTSNDEGRFEFPSVLPGTYDLTVELTGFKKLVRTGTVLSANQRLATGPLTLELGGTQESVMVSGRVEAVQTVSGERSGLITRQHLDNLQVMSRDPVELWARLPGVISDGAGFGPFQVPHAMREVSVMGGRRNNKNMTIDGVSVMNTVTNQLASVTPNMDAVEEVQVQLANYQAEYGRTAGAAINIISRSGTRDFHGSAYFYRRHEDLAAMDFFANKFGQPKTPNRTQTRGFTIGGPAFIPGMFNTDRKKLFFFYSLSQQPFKLPPPLHQITMPTQAERRGDFSQTFDLQGRLVTIRDPLTGQAFPGNLIPSTRLNPQGVQLLNMFPTPNTNDPACRCNYQQSGIQYQQPRNSQTLKLDYNLSDRFTLSGRYAEDHNDIVTDYFSNFSMAKTRLARPGRNVGLRFGQVYSPGLVNESVFGFNRMEQNIGAEDDIAQFQKATYGVQVGQFNPANNPDGLLPNMNFGALVTGTAAPTINNVFNTEFVRHFSFTDNLSYVRGNHVLKFGIYLERGITDSLPAGGNGAFNFAVDANNPNDAGYPYANAALGNFRTYDEPTIRRESEFRFWNVEWYAQDNWRLSRKFTLDYGVRFYWHPPETEASDFMSSAQLNRFDPAKAVRLYMPYRDPVQGNVGYDPVTNTIVPNNMVGAIVPNSGDLSNGAAIAANGDLVDSVGIRLGPRVGFAYDPWGDGNTSIRGGFGVFYDRLGSGQHHGSGAKRPPGTHPDTLQRQSRKLSSDDRRAVPGEYSRPGCRGRPRDRHELLDRRPAPDREPVRGGRGLRCLTRAASGGDARLQYLPAAARFLTANEDPRTPGRALADLFLRPYRGKQRHQYPRTTGSSNYHSTGDRPDPPLW